MQINIHFNFPEDKSKGIIHVRPDFTVGDIHALLFITFGYPSKKTRLYFNNIHLMCDQTLRELCITENDYLIVEPNY
jgi:hypothetical protein